MFFILLLTQLVFASPECPVTEKDMWKHYADEWGHEESKPMPLKKQDIRIKNLPARWMMVPNTCYRKVCNVSFLLKIKNDCWKPLVSVQGVVMPVKRGDWESFTQYAPSSAVKTERVRKVLWNFDFKEKQFKIQTTEKN